MSHDSPPRRGARTTVTIIVGLSTAWCATYGAVFLLVFVSPNAGFHPPLSIHLATVFTQFPLLGYCLWHISTRQTKYRDRWILLVMLGGPLGMAVYFYKKIWSLGEL